MIAGFLRDFAWSVCKIGRCHKQEGSVKSFCAQDVGLKGKQVSGGAGCPNCSG